MQQKVFITKWLVAVIIGFLLLALGVVCLLLRYIDIGCIFAAIGVLYAMWFVFFVPHSFCLCGNKITAVYVARTKTICLSGVKRCRLEGSGIKAYPWGDFYRVVVNAPQWDELKIPRSKTVDLWLKDYIKF